MNRPSQRNSWVRTLPSMTTSVIVVALLCLAALNIAQRASWRELEDGVLWKMSGAARSRPRRSRRGRRPSAPGSSAATSCSQIGGREVQRRRGRRRRAAHEPTPGSDAPVPDRARAARSSRRLIDVAPVPSSPLGALSRARVGRRVLAAGRRVGAAAPAGSPGDAALLLADGRVLRRHGVLVHREARRARLDVLLGRPDGPAPAAAALPAFRAGRSRIVPTRGCAATPGARSCTRSTCRRCCSAASRSRASSTARRTAKC